MTRQTLKVNIVKPDERVKPLDRLHWKRRAVQVLTLVLLVLIPVMGVFRIDPIAGAFVVLGWQIWWSDFFIVFGFWLVLASFLILIYSTLGTVFCGWSCPHNTFSEFANLLTKRLLGKRAKLNIDGKKMKVGSNKNNFLNWIILSVCLLLASLFLALIPLLYFYPPEVIWSFLMFADDERLAESIHYIYLIFTLVIFLDIAFLRHFLCRFMCVYKVWQHGFKTNQTLHLHYDQSRSIACEKCNYCVTACFIDLDPRRTDIFDTCINCGECITACNKLQAKKGSEGLLSFRIGDRQASKSAILLTRLSDLSSRIGWTIPFAVLGLLMFVWGVTNYDKYHLAVYRADVERSSHIKSYRIGVSNKLYQPANVDISIEGLNREDYELESSKIDFLHVGRIDVQLHLKDDLKPGLHPFIVVAQSEDGWEARYRVQHFVPNQR